MKDKETENNVFDILDKMEFFQGQRAGRELWNDKPKEVQDKDISDFVRDIKYIRAYLQNSVVLSRKEYEKLKYTWITDSDTYKKGCKETAEKFLQLAYDRCLEKSFIKKVEELAKQFGLEIKE